MREETQQSLNALKERNAARKARAVAAFQDFKLKALAAEVSAPPLAWQEATEVGPPMGPGMVGEQSRKL